ncbi:hypothetical protein [Frigidibacter mobilis]|uniref:hypothetical protein n=2 Tax=Frigidibacter TaxID=1775705 RepID=UPI00082C5190|nr:hypothetical protein [Frigidibacter mobilis]
MNLATTAAMWPTPQIDSFRSRGGERKDEKGLDRMARDWPTPMANDGCKRSAGNRKTADLTHAAGMWMTPTARDHKDGATTLANTPVNGLLGRQVLVTPMAGSDTCDVRQTSHGHFDVNGWRSHDGAPCVSGSEVRARMHDAARSRARSTSHTVAQAPCRAVGAVQNSACGGLGSGG